MRYLVDLHAHTVASTHAYSTLQEYITAAKERGLKLIAITDHGPDMADAPHEWHFINMQIWPRVVEGVGILRGIEANIKNSHGDIDCSEQMLKTIDLVVAGFHDPVLKPQNQTFHTQAVINMMAQGKVHIMSHPGNPRYPIDIKAVSEAAAQYQVALEINNSSFIHSRIGSAINCLAIIQAVKEAGGWISLGSDSHSAYTIGDFTECIKLIQQVDFPITRILNTHPNVLLDFLQSRGKDLRHEFLEYS